MGRTSGLKHIEGSSQSGYASVGTEGQDRRRDDFPDTRRQGRSHRLPVTGVSDSSRVSDSSP